MTDREYLELDKKYPWYNEYEGCEEDREKIVKYNKVLIERFPWLKPTNVWSGDDIDDYDFSYTWLDSVPDGWRIAFGIQMCKEIQAELEKAQELDPNGGYKESWITTNYDSDKVLSYVEGYRITEIKEKYGMLRWYDNGAPQGVYDVINKYEKLSEQICIGCGKKAEWITTGWISPWCDECKNKLDSKDDFYDRFEKIEEESNENN